MRRYLLLICCCLLVPSAMQAQLSQNPDKFLGNITTEWTNMDYEGFVFSDYWNQVTPENGSKWGIVEGTRGQYNWWNTDVAANYAKQHKFPFKFHTLVWGSQYPDWMNSLSKTEQFKAVVNWMDKVKAHYPNLEMIDVVNEAIEGHAVPPFKEALGGSGVTGYDWIIKAFEMAYDRWPNAILIYNDYSTFQGSTDDFINLVKVLRDAGAPIDAYGCQSHEVGGMTSSNFSNVMTRIQNALKIPMYITEYDIPDSNDNNQNWNFQQHIPNMWEADYCAGVTLWGWFYGHTWVEGSGLIKDGKERPALQWLRTYMQSDKAKKAKSPFPGMVKEASVYIRPSALNVAPEEPVTIEVRAKMRTKTIDHIDLYVNNKLHQTMTTAPYTTDYIPATKGTYTLKAVVTTTDKTTYERLSTIKAREELGSMKYTSLAQLTGGQPFAIVNEEEGKAFYGINNQNLGYDDYTIAFSTSGTGYYFQLESLASNSDTSIRKYYLLRLLKQDGTPYSVWGYPGYLNTQTADKNCCFILGLEKGNGQDLKNGAVWDIQYVDGKGFTLKNVGTGLYLKDATSAANHAEPTYFSFCTTKAATSIDHVEASDAQAPERGIYTLQGVKIADDVQWQDLPRGMYIFNGKKIFKK